MSAPLMLKVPLGAMDEVALMAALDFVVQHFGTSAFPRPLTAVELERAVDWLAAKYGSDSP